MGVGLILMGTCRVEYIQAILLAFKVVNVQKPVQNWYK